MPGIGALCRLPSSSCSSHASHACHIRELDPLSNHRQPLDTPFSAAFNAIHQLQSNATAAVAMAFCSCGYSAYVLQGDVRSTSAINVLSAASPEASQHRLPLVFSRQDSHYLPVFPLVYTKSHMSSAQYVPRNRRTATAAAMRRDWPSSSTHGPWSGYNYASSSSASSAPRHRQCRVSLSNHMTC